MHLLKINQVCWRTNRVMIFLDFLFFHVFFCYNSGQIYKENWEKRGGFIGTPPVGSYPRVKYTQIHKPCQVPTDTARASSTLHFKRKFILYMYIYKPPRHTSRVRTRHVEKNENKKRREKEKDIETF